MVASNLTRQASLLTGAASVVGRALSSAAGPGARAVTSEAGFIRAVRAHDFRSASDADLRAALGQLRVLSGPEPELPRAFAVIGEAVRRRLGIWRLFDRQVDGGPLSRYRQAAARVLQTPADSRSAWGMHDGRPAGTEAFKPALDAVSAETSLDPSDRAIVETMAYVEERRRREYRPDILLPARFYQAAASKDKAGALSFDPTDEQLLAGLLLFQGNVVEMYAGEGKTVAGAFPAIVHAMRGRCVHVITANDYLAARDQEILAPVYESLGLTSAVVLGYMSDKERRAAYSRQIVYSTLREIGFDFLRDNLKRSHRDRVRPRMDAAVVDEADHALIDDSRTPLVIAGGRSAGTRHLHKIRNTVEALVERQRRTVSSLEAAVRGAAAPNRRPRLLARLMLADPGSSVLAERLSSDTRLSRRVRSIADAHDVAGLDQSLTDGLDYVVDPQRRFFTLTESGQRFVEALLGPTFDTRELEARLALIENDQRVPLEERRMGSERLRRSLHRRYGLMNRLYQMLRAYILLERGVDYVVSVGEVTLVDPHTGRQKPESRYQHGLQSAIEAKERVPIRPETEVLAEISVQGLVKRYSTLCGMTGTAVRAADEFRSVYQRNTAAVPPTRPSLRADLPLRLYPTRAAKLSAVVDEIRFWNRVGRPVLVGTLTVERSDEISGLLRQAGVDHRVLNAVNSADEAEVVKAAGSFGAVTVATNMAGRGTDILLQPGLDHAIAERYISLVQGHLRRAAPVILSCGSEHEAALLEQAIARLLDPPTTARAGRRLEVAGTEADGPGSTAPVHMELGLGLHVLGIEMNQSARVDDQLRGRSGRQGEFGSSRLVLSLEDSALTGLTSLWAPKQSETSLDDAGRTFYQGPVLSRRLERLQSVLGQEDAAHRRRSLDYARVTEHVTMRYYRARDRLLRADDLSGTILESIRRISRRLVDKHLPIDALAEYEARFDALAEEVGLDYGVGCAGLFGLGVDALAAGLERLLAAAYGVHRSAFGPKAADLEREVLLDTADELWSAYLSQTQDRTLSSQICAWGHRPAVADFMIDRAGAYDVIIQDATDSFLAAFLRIDPPTAEAGPAPEPDLIEDIEHILVRQEAGTEA